MKGQLFKNNNVSDTPINNSKMPIIYHAAFIESPDPCSIYNTRHQNDRKFGDTINSNILQTPISKTQKHKKDLDNTPPKNTQMNSNVFESPDPLNRYYNQSPNSLKPLDKSPFSTINCHQSPTLQSPSFSKFNDENEAYESESNISDLKSPTRNREGIDLSPSNDSTDAKDSNISQLNEVKPNQPRHRLRNRLNEAREIASKAVDDDQLLTVQNNLNKIKLDSDSIEVPSQNLCEFKDVASNNDFKPDLNSDSDSKSISIRPLPPQQPKNLTFSRRFR